MEYGTSERYNDDGVRSFGRVEPNECQPRRPDKAGIWEAHRGLGEGGGVRGQDG